MRQITHLQRNDTSQRQYVDVRIKILKDTLTVLINLVSLEKRNAAIFDLLMFSFDFLILHCGFNESTTNYSIRPSVQYQHIPEYFLSSVVEIFAFQVRIGKDDHIDIPCTLR